MIGTKEKSKGVCLSSARRDRDVYRYKAKVYMADGG
jgi:hypothetical protein